MSHDGNPLNATVGPIDQPKADWLRVNLQGYYALDLQPGEHTLSVEAAGYTFNPLEVVVQVPPGDSDQTLNWWAIEPYPDDSDAPLQPHRLRLLRAGATWADLQFEKQGDNETGFQVLHWENAGGGYQWYPVKFLHRSETRFRVTHLQRKHSYLFSVAATNNGGRSAPSNGVRVKTKRR